MLVWDQTIALRAEPSWLARPVGRVATAELAAVDSHSGEES
jgi:hypothetical protein